jgi:hypothetical protein
LFRRRFVTGDVPLRRRFVTETFCMDAQCFVWTFCRGDVLCGDVLYVRPMPLPLHCRGLQGFYTCAFMYCTIDSALIYTMVVKIRIATCPLPRSLHFRGGGAALPTISNGTQTAHKGKGWGGGLDNLLVSAMLPTIFKGMTHCLRFNSLLAWKF